MGVQREKARGKEFPEQRRGDRKTLEEPPPETEIDVNGRQRFAKAKQPPPFSPTRDLSGNEAAVCKAGLGKGQNYYGNKAIMVFTIQCAGLNLKVADTDGPWKFEISGLGEHHSGTATSEIAAKGACIDGAKGLLGRLGVTIPQRLLEPVWIPN